MYVVSDFVIRPILGKPLFRSQFHEMIGSFDSEGAYLFIRILFQLDPTPNKKVMWIKRIKGISGFRFGMKSDWAENRLNRFRIADLGGVLTISYGFKTFKYVVFTFLRLSIHFLSQYRTNLEWLPYYYLLPIYEKRP
jgi:hypothetical protein